MNIRKNIDYTEMYCTLNILMKQQLPQMELYCAIGKAVCQRAEKGAAVIAAEYLHENYPDVPGFSPRNVRRMRDFYRTYENYPALLRRAMEIGWIQNVVIMEADLTMEQREWYMKAAKQFGWSKAELIANISAASYEKIVLDNSEEICYGEERMENDGAKITFFVCCTLRKILRYIRYRKINRKKHRRRWHAIAIPLVDSMTGICVKSPFFSDSATLELFPDISKNGTSPKRNRVALVYGTNGSGKSTLARGFREYAESIIPRTVDVVPMSGTNRIKITSNGKPERIRFFDETYISDNIKLQQDGLGSIVLFGHQVQIENRIKEIESNLLSIAEKIEQQKKTCSNYTDTGNMASPAYWLARITKTLQSVGGWAETDGIRIKKHQIKTRVTDTEVKRLGQLVTEKSEEDVTAQFEQLITVYEKTSSASNPISPEVLTIKIPYDVLSTGKIQLSKKPQRVPLSVREQEMLDLMGISTLLNAKGFLSVTSNSICPQCLQPISEQHRGNTLVLLDKILNREIEDYQNSLRKLQLPIISETQFDPYSCVDAMLVENIRVHIRMANAAIMEHNDALTMKIDDPMGDVDYDNSHEIGDACSCWRFPPSC